MYQIDQSGKIEQTSLDTIIAFSNNKKYSVVLHRRVKRLLQEEFRLRRKPRMFIFDTFCALLTIIFLKIKPAKAVFIDKEYFGNEDLIKARVLEFIGKLNRYNYIPEIEFTLVGKSSPAHLLAAKVGSKEVTPDEVISLEQISAVLWPQKKTEYSAINGTKGNLTQGWLPGGRKPSQSFNKNIIAKMRKKYKILKKTKRKKLKERRNRD